ncbi:MBL fold metallo-hydrolase [Larsenimonas suaedae]|uniref:MBL fold metallo-hydrolase n=1 Tax=Larsenimonas suaedae TaxID=1851019 RepID=A0ABU1GTV5_9GAMM|nr:MBL fold metallo-hydrolase [Larsenimonas suaedae]MCM2971891.1 MBL fold metallo-hydrolase [Larsenimonas suaedae]MDR5895443.1 MBL fold metallo-hydrolase [Larsenimonas suaedae]
MAFKFASLGSGSKGNATVIESGESRILIDCGFTLKEIEARLARLDCHASTLDALLITHEHIDHVRGAAALVRRYGLSVYMTPGTWLKSKLKGVENVTFIHPEQCFVIGDLEIDVVTVPHDARQPVQFIVRSGGACLGLLTDIGHVSGHVLKRYRRCDALVLECNHDPDMLARGPYPPSLKRRVGGHWGHLSNQQALEFMQAIDADSLQCVVASHLSEQNNCAERAYDALMPVLGFDEQRLLIAQQHEGLPWQVVRRRLACA